MFSQYSSPGFPAARSAHLDGRQVNFQLHLAPVPVATGGCSILRVFFGTFPYFSSTRVFFLLCPAACTLLGFE